MDLHGMNITLQELLSDPRSNAVFQRRFGKLLRHPMASMANCLTLKQLCQMATGRLPQKLIDDTL